MSLGQWTGVLTTHKEMKLVAKAIHQIPVKAILLAALLGLLSTFALAPRAGAETVPTHWLVNGWPAEFGEGEEVTVELDGWVENKRTFAFPNELHNFTFGCPFNADLRVVGGEENEGQLLNLTFAPGGCLGTGTMKGCSLGAGQDLTLDQMDVHGQKTDTGFGIKVDAFNYAFTEFNESCWGQAWGQPKELFFGHKGDMDMYVDDPEAISKFMWSKVNASYPQLSAQGWADVTPAEYLALGI